MICNKNTAIQCLGRLTPAFSNMKYYQIFIAELARFKIKLSGSHYPVPFYK